MTPTRFCISFVLNGLALAATVAAVNVAVDPYLLFDRPRQAGFNDVKPAAETREHLIKAYAAPRSAARTVILGSSRCDIGLDPAHPLWRESDRPVYNLGLAGANAPDMLHYLQHVTAPGTSAEPPRTVIVCLDFETFLFRPVRAVAQTAAPAAHPVRNEVEERLAVQEDGQPNQARSWRMFQDYALAVLSLDALADSVATIAANRGSGSANVEPNGHMTEAKFREVTAMDGVAAIFAQKNLETVRQYGTYRQVLSKVPGGPVPHFSAVDKMMAIARAQGISLIFAIQPAHADRLELFDQLGYWDDYERWKRALAERVAGERARGTAVTLWDFGGYEIYVQEPIPAGDNRKTRLRWFWDPVHYTTGLGEIMLARMLRQPAPAPYGVELTPEAVDERLAQIRRDREAYRAREPGEAQRRAMLFCSAGDCGKLATLASAAQ